MLTQKLLYPACAKYLMCTSWSCECGLNLWGAQLKSVIILHPSQVKLTVKTESEWHLKPKQTFSAHFSAVTSIGDVPMMTQASVTKGCLMNITAIPIMAIMSAITGLVM